ncbi:hypothetical protein [Opitutus sp. ER46]|uniref:hypothetical protein n=1 Tax=Opitutus sp. ER46 TaxID=2161864 RepID=UPI0011B247E9|nr:hypothetical protein [Opitutus sp. ER46]
MSDLEALVTEEANCFRADDLESVKDVQRRAAPMIEFLVGHADEVADPGLRQRIAALSQRRSDTVAAMQARADALQDELQALKVKERRVAQIAPVYGSSAVASRSKVTLRG